MLNFFSTHRIVAKIDLSIEEQKKLWLANFLKTFFVVFISYLAMYLIRNNLKTSSGMLKDQLGFTTIQLGQIGLVFSITYGIGKSLLGYIVDGKNTKRIISGLLVLSAFCVAIMGIILSLENHPLGLLLILWGLNGLFQSVGGPLSYSTILKWTPRAQRGSWMGTWNTSHNIGGAIAGMVALWGANHLFAGNVAGMFIFPAIIALIIGMTTLFIGYDSPAELGIDPPEVLFNEGMHKDDLNSHTDSKWNTFIKYVLINKWIWLLSIANVFVYIVRIGIDNWAPLYTKEIFNFTPEQQVNTIFYFEMGALGASLIWGWVSDFSGGRRALLGMCCLFLTVVAILGYRYGSSALMINTSIFIIGILIFGPQLLIGVSVVSFVPKKAAAVANGITGTFGYLFGDSIAKIALAYIADPLGMGLNIFGNILHGWNDTFKIFYGAIAIGVILLAIIAYAEEKRIKTTG